MCWKQITFNNNRLSSRALSVPSFLWESLLKHKFNISIDIQFQFSFAIWRNIFVLCLRSKGLWVIQKSRDVFIYFDPRYFNGHFIRGCWGCPKRILHTERVFGGITRKPARWRSRRLHDWNDVFCLKFFLGWFRQTKKKTLIIWTIPKLQHKRIDSDLIPWSFYV